MSLFQRGQRLAIALVAIAFLLVVTPARAIAASLSNVQLIATTEIERRGDAAAQELEGYMQKENGDEVGSPADQLAGRAKQATGATQTRLEDAKSQIQDAADDTKDQGESLVDRIKDFFDAD